MTKHSRITSRQAQAIKTRNKILKTAIEMMQKKGFDNITIKGISKNAGVSVGSFYYYFSSKDDILLEIFHKADDYFTEKINQFTSENAEDKLVEFFAYYARYINSTGIDFAKKLYNTDNKSFNNTNRPMFHILNTIVTNGQSSNEITQRMSAKDISDYLFVAARGVVFEWCLHDGTYSLETAMVNYFKPLVTMFKQ